MLKEGDYFTLQIFFLLKKKANKGSIRQVIRFFIQCYFYGNLIS